MNVTSFCGVTDFRFGVRKMAEAAVEAPGARFFCHKCARAINPVLPDFTCPRCESGFIEELGQNSPDSPNEYTEDDLSHGNVEFELFRLLDNQSDPGNFRGSQDDSSVSRGGAAGGRRVQAFFPAPVTFRRRASMERAGTLASLEGVLHQILANITGGAGNNIPIFLNLHSNPADYAWGRGGLDAIITQLLNQLDCTGPPPLPKEKIKQIPMVKISQDQVDKTLQCTVCMEDYKVGEPVRKLTCQHHFHTDCIVPWLELHATCPICRKLLNEEEGADGTWSSGGGGTNNIGLSSDMDFSSGSSSSSSSSAPHSSSVYDFNDEYD